MSNRERDEEAIFHAVRRIDSDQGRAEYLDQACAGDAALRRRVIALLEMHEQEQSFLKSENAECQATIDAPPLSERPGTTIGRYRIMEQIGEGGMGAVFVAEQRQPIRRKVALKVIKPGMDSKEVIARFEAERAALAMMDHSNIAKVFDAGTTDSGRPYFVMELVRGAPITEYCDQNNLSIRGRLELFVQVCQAIQHAHQKGVIHRDIKPTNVLVTEQDGKCIPKVIDFGVAKALNQSLTERTLYTSFQAIVGTPLYMSPEQAALSNVDVDTRSDVYSLGVLLYELLTGTTPFDKQQIHNAAIDEIRRVIRETDPPKPSTRISRMGKSATLISTHRNTDPARLNQLIRGDLDWIVMKALEKDRMRRFQAASSLADDVCRSLNDEPIAARPPSAAYRFRKFVKRNRAGAAAAVVLILAVLIAGTGITAGLVRAAKKAHEAQQTLTSLHDEIYERAIHEVISGGAEERIKKLIEDADNAGVSQERLHVLKGILAFYTDKQQEAIKWLEKGEKSVASLAVLAWAYVVAGEHKKAIETNRELKLTEPNSSIDRLLRGQFLSVVLPAKALIDIDEAMETLDTSIYAHTVRATATAFLGWQDQDIALVDDALTKVKAARAFQPENSFVLLANAQVHLVKYRMLLRAKQPIPPSFFADAKAIAAACRESAGRNVSYLGADLLAQLGDIDGAVAMLLETLEDGRSGFTPMMLAPIAILAGRESEAIDALSESASKEDVFTRVAFEALQVGENTNRQTIIEFVDQIERDYESADARMYALHLLLMIKEPKLAEEKAGEMLETTHEMVLPYEAHIEYLAGGSKKEAFLKESPKLGHFDVGLKAFAEGNLVEARDSFGRSIEVDIYSCQYWWSRVFLKRLGPSPVDR